MDIKSTQSYISNCYLPSFDIQINLEKWMKTGNQQNR
jgi:hypothetical protein